MPNLLKSLPLTFCATLSGSFSIAVFSPASTPDSTRLHGTAQHSAVRHSVAAGGQQQPKQPAKVESVFLLYALKKTAATTVLQQRVAVGASSHDRQC
jgi:hypothetical protein